MARNSRKGYYIDGKFVVAGSDADKQIRSEEQDSLAPSRTELKHASERLQKLGEELLELRADRLATLSLPEKLHDAILDAKRFTSFGAKRRQKQFIGRLMRQLDPDTLDAVRAALHSEHGRSATDAHALHRAEQWREELIADDEQMVRWIEEFPGTDAQHLRALIRQARKDAADAAAGEGRRHGRAFRQIFTLVREQLGSAANADPEATSGHDDDAGSDDRTDKDAQPSIEPPGPRS
jgi:ribosome-associated protein